MSEMYWGVPRPMPELEPEDCDDCGHPIRLHGSKGCEFERGDRWVTGSSGVGGWIASGRCRCTAVNDFQDLLERCAKHYGT